MEEKFAKISVAPIPGYSFTADREAKVAEYKEIDERQAKIRAAVDQLQQEHIQLEGRKLNLAGAVEYIDSLLTPKENGNGTTSTKVS